MVALPLILLQTVLLFEGISGWSSRTPCTLASKFRCDDGICINKNAWCDYSNHCYDGSDEKYCRRGYSTASCDDTIHYSCERDDVCIPIEGRCDGYASCADLSDEWDCPCEELFDDVGKIQYEAFIGAYQTHNRCWKLVLKEGQYVNITVQAHFYSRYCTSGNITLKSDTSAVAKWFGENEDSYDYIVCPNSKTQLPYTLYGSVKIRYRSSFYVEDEDLKDILNISYVKVSSDCLNPHAFKCSTRSCILPEKQCDGYEDCENGLDEQNCDFAAFSAAYLKRNLRNATLWMRSQHNADWGWNTNTHRAIVALYLDNNLMTGVWSDDLIAKQLELEVSTHLLRNERDKISPTELASYINALLAICHNPRNFFGFDLVQKLKSEIEKVQDFITPLPWLTLCNAKESIPERVVNSLLQNLQKPSDVGFILEIQSLSIMALTCISSDDKNAHLKQNITNALKKLKLEQRDDGSFGNVYTTALVLQALMSNDQVNGKDWNFKSSIEFLRQKQRSDGSFGDFLTTYLVMPILNAKSLVDLGKVNCTENMIRPKEGSVTSDIKSRLGGKIPIKYSLFVGDQKDQIHPIFLRAPENITAFELMILAADIDSKYMFKTHEIKEKIYVYEIFNIPNDPENNKFWFLYQNVGNETVLATTQAPDELHVHENDHIIMWYKCLNTVVQNSELMEK